MHSQRCQRQQIYKETFLLLRPNSFIFLKRYFRDTHRLMYKKLNSFVHTFAVNGNFFSPNKPVRKSPIKLKINILNHINNTLRITDFLISVTATSKIHTNDWSNFPVTFWKPVLFIWFSLFKLTVGVNQS